ncbi:putative S-adenosyl-L-methionine-dependent methyltransferase [Rosa chinensis]|uniref:Putative S-adenosyl-L-methionine-dependent methyltransferase n=1 Tax=Rosa chinensis TaxID=74649 RepID=A0A2P6RM51_ROSCH|nr:probable methyltransferase PMT27 [Rosa chinensis]PRQ47493.1 putative S-adenosyl-L-methionine-dependent methyltransferase [Rosa chinensis]
MALGNRSRSSSNKRSSSSSSYTSTVMVMGFIALCVVGVWMMNYSSAGVSTQTTTARTNTVTSTASSDENNTQAAENNNNNNEKPKAFEDNPGDLPDDAIKNDDGPNKSDAAAINEGKTSREKQEQDAAEEQKEDQKQQELNQAQLSEETTIPENQQAEQTATQEKIITADDQPDEKNHQQKNNNGGQSGGNDQIDVESKPQEQPAETNSDNSKQNNNAQAFQDKKPGNADQTQMQQQQQQQQQQPQKHQHQQQQQEEQSLGVERNENSQESQNNIQGSSNQQQQQQQQENQHQQHSQEQEHHDQQKPQQYTDETNHVTTLPTIPDQNQQKKNQGEQQQQQQQQQEESYPQRKKGNAAADQNNKGTESNSGETLLNGGDSSGIPKESKESKKSWRTQADQSENEKERRKDEKEGQDSIYGYTWQLCNVTTGPDYIPCLDNEKAIKKLRSTKHFQHRERHCPQEGPTCLVPHPEGYKTSIQWPKSRDKIWYHNVPHTLLAEVKGHQNWVKVSGEFLTFPGGGTQFIHGALLYIDFLQNAVPNLAWGKHTRVILDVGCGVASFGGYLFDRDVLTMSFAPKDEHEAQVQFALERGIPAISAVMGTQRLPFPSRVFDAVHCARCRVPWHLEGGMLLLELNRVLRPGGYFIWSATPVYGKLDEDKKIWKEMTALTKSMCWDLITIKNNKVNLVAAAIYRKPTSNQCYEQRKQKQPPMCKTDDDPNAAWYVPLQACMHRVPVDKSERGTQWPENWPNRLETPPYWLNSSRMGIYGKPAPQDFARDYEHWKRVINNSYMKSLGINWSGVRNVMDMRAVYGGFAAALKDLKVWVMNVVNVDSADTLPIIYERGLFGIYHDWCESFSTYPRTYDLLHADHLFSSLKKRCRLPPVMAEIDRIVRPGGKLIVRDESNAIGEVENLLKSLHWEVHLTFSKNQEGMLSAQKGNWRPTTSADTS